MKCIDLTFSILFILIGSCSGFSQVFQDDFMSETTGTFPGKWEVGDGTAMADVSSIGEKTFKNSYF